MDRHEIQRLRDLPIEGVAERLGLRVARHKALCPFHDDHHASLSFNTRRNVCRCFVCMDESMDGISLVMRRLGTDFRAACRWLADGSGIILDEWKASPRHEGATAYREAKPFDAGRYARFFEHPWLGREARRFLFEERGIDERVASWCRLSSWQDREGTHWLQTPYFDVDGKLIGIQSRNLDYPPKAIADTKAASGGKPRFRFPPGAKCGIYNLPVTAMLKPGDELYVTEGCSDCWAMLSAGHKAIAIPSATLLTPDDRQLLADLDRSLDIRWHMYPDSDTPGERLFLQLRELLPAIVRHQLPPGCKDFAESYLKSKKKFQR